MQAGARRSPEQPLEPKRAGSYRTAGAPACAGEVSRKVATPPSAWRRPSRVQGSRASFLHGDVNGLDALRRSARGRLARFLPPHSASPPATPAAAPLKWSADSSVAPDGCRFRRSDAHARGLENCFAAATAPASCHVGRGNSAHGKAVAGPALGVFMAMRLPDRGGLLGAAILVYCLLVPARRLQRAISLSLAGDDKRVSA